MFETKKQIEWLESRIQELQREKDWLKKELKTRCVVQTGNYTRTPLDCLNSEDIMTVEEFLNEFEFGYNSDGTAYPMKDGLEDIDAAFSKDCLWRLPKDATHVSWYNK